MLDTSRTALRHGHLIECDVQCAEWRCVKLCLYLCKFTWGGSARPHVCAARIQQWCGLVSVYYPCGATSWARTCKRSQSQKKELNAWTHHTSAGHCKRGWCCCLVLFASQCCSFSCSTPACVGCTCAHSTGQATMTGCAILLSLMAHSHRPARAMCRGRHCLLEAAANPNMSTAAGGVCWCSLFEARAAPPHSSALRCSSFLCCQVAGLF